MQYIIIDPKIMGGEPIIKGTRVTVRRITKLLSENFSLDEISCMYPHIDKNVLAGTVSELGKIINKYAPSP